MTRSNTRLLKLHTDTVSSMLDHLDMASPGLRTPKPDLPSTKNQAATSGGMDIEAKLPFLSTSFVGQSRQSSFSPGVIDTACSLRQRVARFPSWQATSGLQPISAPLLNGGRELTITSRQHYGDDALCDTSVSNSHGRESQATPSSSTPRYPAMTRGATTSIHQPALTRWCECGERMDHLATICPSCELMLFGWSLVL